MRRTEMYRTNKLRLLHKLLGMKNLARHYDGERSSSERLWYTGYHVYSNREQVMNLFNEGKPLCCVIFPENGNEICVAHYSGVADEITCIVFSSGNLQKGHSPLYCSCHCFIFFPVPNHPDNSLVIVLLLDPFIVVSACP